MKQSIKSLYNLEVFTFIKISSDVYRMKTNYGDFALKYIPYNENLESVIVKLDLLGVESFVIPLKNSYNRYISSVDNIYFMVLPWYEEDGALLKDLKLRFFLNVLATLHSKSFYVIKVNEAFFKQTYDFIADKIDDMAETLDKYMTRIERLDYKSPSEWLFLLNYPRYREAINKANSALEKFKRKCENKSSLRMVFTYNNFNYDHILLKTRKVIGVENIEVAPPVYDIFYTFSCLNEASIDFETYYKEYFKTFILEDYEKEWLTALIYIPQIQFSNNEAVNISNICNSLNYLKNAQEIAKIISLKYKEEGEKEDK